MNSNTYWIGVDLDGTLAHYDKWRGGEHIGPPNRPVVELVRRLIVQYGLHVKVVSARAADYPTWVASQHALNEWCELNGLPALELVAGKDMFMTALLDDRAVTVPKNWDADPAHVLGETEMLLNEVLRQHWNDQGA